LDELYFEEGYVETRYFGIIANANSSSYYIIDDYLLFDYFEYQGAQASLSCDFDVVIIGTTKEFEIAVVSTVTNVTNAVKTVTVSSNLNTAFTQETIGSRGKDIDMFAFTDAAIAAQVNVIRDSEVTASTVFSVAADVARIRSLDSDASSDFAIIGLVERSRAVESQTQAAFSFAVTENLFRDFAADITGEFAQSTTEDLFKAFSSDLESVCSLSSTEDYLRGFDADLSGNITVSANFRVVRDAHLTGTGIAAVSCDANYTAVSSADVSAQASITSLGGLLETTAASLTAFNSILVSRYAGSNRPITVVGTFDSYELINSATRPGSDFSGLINSENWFFATSINVRSDLTFRVLDGEKIVDVPLGNGYIRATIRYRSNEGATFSILVNLGGITTLTGQWNNGNVGESSHGVNIGVSFTGGQRLAIYANGARIALNTNYDTSNWAITTNQTVNFAPDFPVSRFGTIHTAYTNWSWLTEENKTNSGDTGYDFSSSAPTNTPETLFLYQFNGNGNEDLAIAQFLNAALSSQFSTSAVIGGQFGFAADLTSAATVSAVIGTIEDINLVAFTDAAVSAIVVKTTENPADLLAESNQTISFVRTRELSSAVIATSTIDATAERNRDNDVSASSEFTQSTDVVKTTDIVSNLESVAQLSANGGRLEEINLVAFTDGAILATVNINASALSAISSEFDSETSGAIIYPLDSALTSTASVSSIADRSRDNEIDLSSELTIAATALRIQPLDITLESVALQQTDVNYTAENQANFNVTVSIVATIDGNIFAELIATSAATVSADAVKQVSAEIDKSAEFSVTAIPLRGIGFIVDVTAEFSLVANAVTAGEINAVLFNQASLSVTLVGTKTYNSALLSEFTQNTDTQDSLVVRGIGTLAAEFAQISAVNYIAGADIDTDSIASQLTVAVKEVATDIVCETRFEVTAIVAKTTDVDSAQQSSAEQTTIGAKITDITSDITSSASISVDSVIVTSAVINTESIASQLSVVARTAVFFINADLVSIVAADINVLRSAESTLESQTLLSIDGGAVRFAGSDLSMTASTAALTGVIRPANIVINSAMAFTAGIREIRTDTLVYVIPGEGWIYEIDGESRNFDIIGETRIYNVRR
jgi:hypothetical protein